MSILEELRPILEKATLDERRELREILDRGSKDLEPGGGGEYNWFSPEDIAKQLQWRYQSIWGWMFREDENVSYTEIVVAVAKKLKIESPDIRIEDLEQQIIQRIFEKAWEKMTPAQRKKMEHDLQQEAQKFGKNHGFAGLGGPALFAALIAGRFAGFSAYMLVSSALKAVTSAVGITLPFAAYMGASRAVGLFLGPVGLGVTGVLTIIGLSGGNYKRVIPFVVSIALLRAKQKESRGIKRPRTFEDEDELN